MKKWIALAGVFLALAMAQPAEAAKGVIALVNDDKIVVYTDEGYGGYTCADVMGMIWDFHRGDVIYNIEDSYGPQTWYNKDRDAEFDVYVDEYWADEDLAMDFFSN